MYDAGARRRGRRYRTSRGWPPAPRPPPPTWVALLSQGTAPLMKYGSASAAVRRLQRALNAADAAGLPVTGVFEARTTAAVKRYQRYHGLPQTGVVTTTLWAKLLTGTR